MRAHRRVRAGMRLAPSCRRAVVDSIRGAVDTARHSTSARTASSSSRPARRGGSSMEAVARCALPPGALHGHVVRRPARSRPRSVRGRARRARARVPYVTARAGAGRDDAAARRRSSRRARSLDALVVREVADARPDALEQAVLDYQVARPGRTDAALRVLAVVAASASSCAATPRPSARRDSSPAARRRRRPRARIGCVRACPGGGAAALLVHVGAPARRVICRRRADDVPVPGRRRACRSGASSTESLAARWTRARPARAPRRPRRLGRHAAVGWRRASPAGPGVGPAQPSRVSATLRPVRGLRVGPRRSPRCSRGEPGVRRRGRPAARRSGDGSR